MDLRLISDTVSSICEAIANVLDVDVIVVDKDLMIIGNTYKYMVENDINVSETSIVGTSIFDRVNRVVMNIDEVEKCRICKSRDSCKLRGVISIPILHENHIFGAIGIMLESVEKQEAFRKNLEGIKVFLENMADLLISKLISVDQMDQIRTINHEIEHIITNVKDGIIYLDRDNRISYFNNVFVDYFNIKTDIKNQKISQVIDHPIINNYLFSKKNLTDEVFVLQNSSANFKGLISCVNTNLNSQYLGSIITFRKIEETFRVMNEMLNNKSKIKMSHLICHDEDIYKEIDLAKKVAITDEAVLITGDSGVGKKTLAYSIHNFSNRKSNYVITIDCKYLPRSYYLSELFGIGESMINPGMLQLAHKGTIVFNEITNLPLNIQMDILSLITTGEIELEKGIVIKDIDVRIIGTTKHDIKAKVKEGYFSEELYYRLNGNSFYLKPLTERTKEDFFDFTLKFLDNYSKIFTRPKIDIEDEAIEALMNESWDENLKGLEKFLEQLVYHLESSKITAEMIEDELYKLHASTSGHIKTFDEYEKEFIENALNQYKGVKNRIFIVADKLGIGRATLYRKVNKYNLPH